MRIKRFTIWIGAGAASLALGAGAFALLGGVSANGSTIPPPPVVANESPLVGVPPCTGGARPSTAANGKPTCIAVAASPVPAAPVGSVGPDGTVTTNKQVALNHGLMGYTFHGQPLTPATADVLRIATGPAALYVQDSGPFTVKDFPFMIRNQPTPEETAASARYGGTAVAGMMEVTSAPLAAYPVRPGDNSLGWTTSAS